MIVPTIVSNNDDDLLVPSSPPRRLSRSSIDLRDLEYKNEAAKIKNSDSVSSIFPLQYENNLRYSGSEPIHVKENQQRRASRKESFKQINFFQPFFSRNSLLKSYIKSGSATGQSLNNSNNRENSYCNNRTASEKKLNNKNKDNRSNNNIIDLINVTSSLNKESVGTEKEVNTHKRHQIAASESDFLTMIQKQRSQRMGLGKNNTSVKKTSNIEGPRADQLMYALSDSDFTAAFQADENIMKCFKNLKASAEHKDGIFKITLNGEGGTVPVAAAGINDTPDILIGCFDHGFSGTRPMSPTSPKEIVSACAEENVLIKSSNLKVVNSSTANVNSTVSDSNLSHTDGSYVIDLISAISSAGSPPHSAGLLPEAISRENEQLKSNERIAVTQLDSLKPVVNLGDTGSPVNVLSEASTISLDLVSTGPSTKLQVPSAAVAVNAIEDSVNPVDHSVDAQQVINNPDIIIENIRNDSLNNQQQPISTATSTSVVMPPSIMTPSPVHHPGLHRKRQSSTVTYNINVINFSDNPDDDGGSYQMNNRNGTTGGTGSGAGAGGRSNSSTSEYNPARWPHLSSYLFLSNLLYISGVFRCVIFRFLLFPTQNACSLCITLISISLLHPYIGIQIDVYT